MHDYYCNAPVTTMVTVLPQRSGSPLGPGSTLRRLSGGGGVIVGSESVELGGSGWVEKVDCSGGVELGDCS